MASRYPLVPSDEPPVVGSKYLVKCVRFLNQDNAGYSDHLLGWVPVIGPAHEDKDIIGLKTVHYHVDVRFLRPKQLARLDAKQSRAYIQPFSIQSKLDGVHFHYEQSFRVRTCQNVHDFPDTHEHKVKWHCPLRDAYRETALKDGLVCPHKGIPLAPFADEDGFAICPGHGLCWNLKERRLATDAEELATRERRAQVAA